MDEDYYRTVADEILGDVDVFTYSRGGPNGPWDWRSLTIRRKNNRILVNDVDGRRAETIDVADLPNGDEARSALVERLDELDEETLAAL